MKIAQATVKANLAKVLTLADRLTEHGQIEAADFCCRAEAARVSTADTPQRKKIGARDPRELHGRVQEFVLVFARSVAIRD